MKWSTWLLVAGGAGVVGFVVGRQVTQNMVTRNAARMVEAARLAGLKSGTVIAAPGVAGVVP